MMIMVMLDARLSAMTGDHLNANRFACPESQATVEMLWESRISAALTRRWQLETQ
jgi:hypothetical protein